MSFFRLDRPMGPRLMQILYGIALAVIAIGLVAGTVRGVRVMTSPPLAGSALPQASATPGGAAMPAIRPGRQNMPPRFLRHRAMMGPFGRGPGFARRLPPAAQGGFILLLTVVRALIAWLVVRILAEMGLAVLALRSKPAP